jgi:hypothetical protein
MELTSTAFKNGGSIPDKYTCQGEGISPPLSWSNLPTGTKTLALSLIDPDAPSGDFVHWLIYNIKPEQDGIKEAGSPVGVELKNDGGGIGYYPPCPPSGQHRYVFKLYALGREIEGVREENFLAKVKKVAIETQDLVGLYAK